MRRLVALAVFLGGCLDDEARPLDDFLDDSQYVQGLPDAALPDVGFADPGPEQCSDPGFLPGKHVRFENRTPIPLALFWVKPECAEQPWATILPGLSLDQDTFVGHVWRVRTQEDRRVFEIRITDTTPDVIALEAP
jgi:hypothetical protein